MTVSFTQIALSLWLISSLFVCIAPTAADELHSKSTTASSAQFTQIIGALEQRIPEVKKEWQRLVEQDLKAQNTTVAKLTALTKQKETVGGVNSKQLLMAQAILAELNYLDGRRDDARILQKRILQTARSLPAGSNVLPATIQSDLAEVYLEEGDYPEAEKLLVQALQGLPSDNSNLLKDTEFNSLNNLAAKWMLVVKMIADAPPAELTADGGGSFLMIGTRLAFRPQIPTMNKAGAYLALARVYLKEGKTELAQSNYELATKYADMHALSGLK